MQAIEFVLISRSYCHLCEVLHQDLIALAGSQAIDVVIKDVDESPELLARFDELVPVLLDKAGNELCHYRLDAVKVLEYMRGLG